MNTTVQLTDLLAEYDNPIQLKNKICNLLNTDFYNSHPDEYIRFADTLYSIAEHKKDWPLKYKILCEWLLLTDFKNDKSLSILKQWFPTFLLHLVSQNKSSEIKYKIFDVWYKLQNVNEIPFSNKRTNSATNILYHLNQAITKPVECIIHINDLQIDDNITKLYNFDNLHVIKIIGDVLPNIRKSSDLKQAQRCVTEIIDTIDFDTVSELDAVALFKWSEFIYASTFNKLGTYYYNEKFKMILDNAIALGVADNLNYWIQSLPSNSTRYIDNTSLPIF